MAERQTVEQAPITAWWLDEGVAPPMICNVSPLTGEFMGLGLADPSPLEPGVWLIPAHAHQGSSPEIVKGFVPVRDAQSGEWVQMVDHRGVTVYDTASKAPQAWEALGELPDGYTHQAPASEYDAWDGERWVLDQAALNAALLKNAARKKALLTQFTANKAGTLQYAVDKGVASDGEAALLDRWKMYAVQLDRVEPGAVTSPDDWPNSPDDEALAGWLESQEYADLPAIASTETP